MFIPLYDNNTPRHTRIQYTILAIITANILIWLFFNTPALVDPQTISVAYLSYGYVPAIANGYETLPAAYATPLPQASFITYAFFHSDFMHLAGNMLFLWVFGDNVEDAMGHIRFLFFYLACTAVAAWAYGIASPHSTAPLIGASGGASGVVAAYLILHPKVRIWVLVFGKIPLRLSALWLIGAWIGYQFFELAFNVDGNISWIAHTGGILTGALLIIFMHRPDVQLFDRGVKTFAMSEKNTGTDEFR